LKLKLFFTSTYCFLIISACTAIFSPILTFTAALSYFFLLSLKDVPSFIFDTNSVNFTLLPNISISSFISNSIYSTMSTLGIRNRIYLIFITSGYCMHCTPILILYPPLFSLPLEKYFYICITDSGIPSALTIYSYMWVYTFSVETSKLSSYWATTTVGSVAYTTFVNFPKTILYSSMHNLLGGSSSIKYK